MKRWGCASLVLLACALAGGAEAAQSEPAYPLWDGKETITDYARRTGLEPTAALDCGNGVTMELVLVPAGKFIMGTPEPEPVDEAGLAERIVIGRHLVIGAGAVLLVLLAVVVTRAIRERHRPQYSLARLMAMFLVACTGVGGGTNWYMASQELTRQRFEHAAAKARYQEASDTEGPAHDVTIQRPFYMSRYEVTQEQYQAVMDDNPSLFKSARNLVETVVWFQAQWFCKEVVRRTGKTLRLPTEAEWEYACRAGMRTEFHSGDGEEALGRTAWYYRNSNRTTHPVGQKEPNTWGLYDMHGNVWEWVEDDWHDNYTGAPADGRAWVDEPRSSDRVLRGGSCRYSSRNCTSACRNQDSPRHYNGESGFRVVVLLSRTP